MWSGGSFGPPGANSDSKGRGGGVTVFSVFVSLGPSVKIDDGTLARLFSYKGKLTYYYFRCVRDPISLPTCLSLWFPGIRSKDLLWAPTTIAKIKVSGHRVPSLSRHEQDDVVRCS